MSVSYGMPFGVYDRHTGVNSIWGASSPTLNTKLIQSFAQNRHEK